MSGSMEIDPPHESDGSTTGSKESEIPVVSDSSGLGLPYAPEDFPEPGDKWAWRVGKRVSTSGHFVDRYLYPPDRFLKELKLSGFTGVNSRRCFASKASVERYVVKTFPGTDINAFFASFTWKIPAAKISAANIKGNKEIICDHPVSYQQFEPAGCKAGNINCSSLLETSNLTSLLTMPCDICCIEPVFCHDCCCILCSRPVSSANEDHSFIRCEAVVNHGFICGHICHIECGLRSYMAGTVGGTIGLDAEYLCRRCDARTDLVPHVEKLLKSCESICDCDKAQKVLNLCIIILRGSTKTSAKNLQLHVQSKLKDRNCHEGIWKREDTSVITTRDKRARADLDPKSTASKRQQVHDPPTGSTPNVVATEIPDLLQRIDFGPWGFKINNSFFNNPGKPPHSTNPSAQTDLSQLNEKMDTLMSLVQSTHPIPDSSTDFTSVQKSYLETLVTKLFNEKFEAMEAKRLQEYKKIVDICKDLKETCTEMQEVLKTGGFKDDVSKLLIGKFQAMVEKIDALELTPNRLVVDHGHS